MTFRIALLSALLAVSLAAAGEMTRDAVIAHKMKPYDGESTPGVDVSTLEGKVICGYQGWFTCEGDGADRGWFHWGRNGVFKPGSCGIDFWPDMRELGPEERYDTPFRHADGRVAQVFSSLNAATVKRHFRWMRDYGIDAAFVQRFAGETFHAHGLNHTTTVLGHCRAGANAYGRMYAVMYDLSGMKDGQMDRVMDDWRALVDHMRIAHDPNDKAYAHHRGKPVVAVWGIGFNDDRLYTLDECARLVDFLKHDPDYGGNCVMLGVPTYWRTLRRDALPEPKLHEIIQMADIVSPWTVGRYIHPPSARTYAQKTAAEDLAWCRERGLDFLPVVFPGFSWHNLKPEAKLGRIPRRKGAFLWAQYCALKQAGATMIYQAMFDEVDEGTAIFKCTNDPPVGASPFMTYEGLPTDYYLWLVGMGGKLLRGEIPVSEEPPPRPASNTQ